MARLLVRFSKLGSLRFISHLDTVEVLKRAIRRACLPVAYSAGSSPQMRISILHALPVGAESVAEYLNVELARPMAPERFREALASQLPEGFEIRSVRGVARKFSHPSLEFTYRVTMPGGELPSEEAIREFLSRSAIPLVRRRKGREREEDIRPILREVRREGEALLLRVACVDGQSVRPEDVVKLLVGREPGAGWRVVKLETTYGDR